MYFVAERKFSFVVSSFLTQIKLSASSAVLRIRRFVSNIRILRTAEAESLIYVKKDETTKENFLSAT